MTQEEGNKLIGDFMGLYLDEKCQYADWDGMHDAEYHSSWDWLMPVVEKIGAMPINFNVNINSFDGCSIYDDDYKSTARGKVFNSGINGTLIQCTWKAVIQFLQWYNTTKK